MTKGLSRLSKLRAMSLTEVRQRLHYRYVIAAERRLHRQGRLAGPDRLSRSLSRHLRGTDWRARLLASRRTTSTRYLPGAHEPARMRALFDTRYRSEFADTVEQAAQVRSHRFAFFGQTHEFGREIAWQTDPMTGQQWPGRYHADVPVHGGDVGFGDVKHVWELNRQQYLIDLGKAFFLTGQRENLDSLTDLVRTWRVGNPYATGVNWACALEPAFRVLSWLWAYHLTADALDDDFHIEWLEGFYDHGRFLARHLEHYSSPYNHLIGEATALYSLGLCFPEFEASPRWRAVGRDVLERRLGQQFYEDGGSVEQSTFYHHATVGFYLLAALTARANGESLSPEVWDAIERGIRFSARLVQPDGRIPEIGGADDGKPIRMEHLPFWDFRPYQAIGAVLFHDSGLKGISGRFHEDALWLLGPDGLTAFDGLAVAHPAETSALLSKSGYAVSRSDWSARADYVCFDVGEQAAGMRTDNVPNSMHGHADALSVIVSLRGRRVLVDSGFYAYNCGGIWEAHFRETAAHNTARIDSRDQARHLGKMAWSHSYRVTVEGHAADATHSWTIASHDGYARGPGGVTHRRAVWRRPDSYLIVYDEFVGEGDHEVEVNWQFAPGSLALSSAGALFGDEVELVWLGASTWDPVARTGGSEPHDGWICPSLGVRQPAPRLTLRGRASGRQSSLLTVVAARQSGRPRVSVVQRDGINALAIEGDGTIDWVVAPALSSRSPIETDGVLAVCRTRRGEPIERAHAGGTMVKVDSEALAALVPSRALVPGS